MGLTEEKWVKLTDILTRFHGVSRYVGTSLQHARALAAAASSPIPFNLGVSVPLPAVQPSPTSLSCRGKAVVIESNEDSAKGSIYKKPKPTPVMVSPSSSSDHSVSPQGRTTSASLLPDLGEIGASPSSVPELPFVLQHAIKGFQQGVTVDLDEAAVRKRLGFNFGALLAQVHVSLSRAESGNSSSLARSLAACEGTLREELVHFSMLLHAKRQEVTALEVRVLSLRVRVFELEEAKEESKAQITGLE